MTSFRRNRQRRPGRRQAFRDPKPIILIVCEGRNSEPQYLEGFSRSVHNARVAIRIQPGSGVPRTVVETAKRLKNQAKNEANREGDENLAYDSVWCVFDVDDHPNIADAQQMATDSGIHVALSNPSFELWLLLHFRESPGMQHRNKIVEILKTFVCDYDKNVDYGLYTAGYSNAVRRATQLEEAATASGEPGRNPSTGVYVLTEKIREE